MCPPIDDLPPPPTQAAASSIDDLPPPPPPAEEPGILSNLAAGAKNLVSGMSLPSSLSDAGKRLAGDGLFRTPAAAPATDADGPIPGRVDHITDIASEAKARTGSSAPMYPLFAGGGLGNAAARVASGSVLAGADAGTKTPGTFDVNAAKKGAEFGGALGLLVEGVGGAVGTGEGAAEFANDRSASAMGWNKALRKKLGQDAAQQAGRVGLDEGVVTPLASTADKLERMQGVQDQAGKAVGGVMDSLDQAGIKKFNPLDTAADVQNQMGGKFTDEPLFGSQSKQYDNLLQTISKRGAENISFADAQKLKQLIGEYAYKNDAMAPGLAQARQAYGIVNHNLDNAVEQGASELGNDDLLAQLQKAKANYSAAKNTVPALEGKQAGELGNQQFGLQDAVLAAPHLAANPLGAAATLGIKGAATRYGNNLAAVGADKLAALLSNSPGTFGQFAPVLAAAAQRGPAALQATHAMLLKTNPDYAKQLGGGGGN